MEKRFTATLTHHNFYPGGEDTVEILMDSTAWDPVCEAFNDAVAEANIEGLRIKLTDNWRKVLFLNHLHVTVRTLELITTMEETS